MPDQLPQLRPLQRESAAKMLHFLQTNPARGCYNASERGTGKTATSLYACWALHPQLVVVICPSVVKLNWKAEILKWSRWKEREIIQVISSSKDINTNIGYAKQPEVTQYCILSYELARQPKITKWLSRQSIDLLILDEAHRVKSTKGVTKKAILETIWPRAKYKICLSGTPFTRSVLDCWTLFSRLSPHSFKDYYTFANRYCYREMTPWGENYYGLKNHEGLKAIIRTNFFVRYTLQEMASEVPPLIWNKVSLGEEYAVKLTDEEKAAWDKYLALLDESLEVGSFAPTPPKHLTTRRREQGLKKLPGIVEYVKEMLDSEEPTIVGFIYLEVMHEFIRKMEKYEPSVIHGSVSSGMRQEAIENFETGKTNLIVMQLVAGGIGINLQRAKNVVHGELDYSPAVVDQFNGRAQRIGQLSAVNVHYFVVEDTIDAEIARTVLTKSKMFKRVLD